MYVYCDKAVDAHVDAHLIRACKFSMTLVVYQLKETPVYKLFAESECIYEDALQE